MIHEIDSRHRIVGCNDTLMLDPLTSLIVTSHTGMKHYRAGKLDPGMYEALV